MRIFPRLQTIAMERCGCDCQSILEMEITLAENKLPDGMSSEKIHSINIRVCRSPRFWRRVTPAIQSHVHKRDWQLVFNARNIPYRIRQCGNDEFIYVPPLYEKIARHELDAYANENSTPVKAYSPPPRKDAWMVAFYPLALIVWHGSRINSSFPHFNFLPDPSTWLALGQLDRIKILEGHEFYRLATALTLHVDSSHLGGNIFFGTIFLFLLARIAAPGRALLLTLCGGMAGNAISLFFHRQPYVSIGFSTALFACIGILGGIMASMGYRKRQALVAAGASMSLLAMLGAAGENTDYAAHIAGLFCGLAMGIYTGPQLKKCWSRTKDIVCFCLAFIIPIAAWCFAFEKLRVFTGII